jgi:hypothetical protein
MIFQIITTVVVVIAAVALWMLYYQIRKDRVEGRAVKGA